MAYTTINKQTDYFNTKLYAGNGGTNNITGVGFQPDWVWIKKRNATANHHAFDAVRGVTKVLKPNETDAETTVATTLTSFDSDGFTVGSDTSVNGNLLASWNWKANGAGSSNTDGTINTTVSANTTAGFSIVKWTGTGGVATIGHGLGVTPAQIIFKQTTGTQGWIVWNKSFNARTRCVLNTDAVASTSQVNFMNDTLPTSSLIHLKDDADTNGSGSTYIAYVFAEKTGYSKFGSYEGNNNADGTFVYTGFKPSFIMFKNIDTAGAYWVIKDNKRSASGGTNENKYVLYPNSNDAEGTNSSGIDLLSNGFKFRENAAGTNQNTIIYMAFGQSIVGSNNIPATAR